MAGDYKGILGYALNAINQNPELRERPEYADMIRAIEQNDAQAGVAIANQLLQRYGVSRGAAINRAAQIFNLPGGRLAP